MKVKAKAECSIKIGLFKTEQPHNYLCLEELQRNGSNPHFFLQPYNFRSNGFCHRSHSLSSQLCSKCPLLSFGNHGNQSLTVNTFQSVHRAGAHISIYVHVGADTAGSKLLTAGNLSEWLLNFISKHMNLLFVCCLPHLNICLNYCVFKISALCWTSISVQNRGTVSIK